MKPKMSLRRALEDTKLLDMGDPSWIAWRALLLGVMGEKLNDQELEHFRKLTKRDQSPTEPVSEFWACVGRRGGKSRSIAALAIFVAALCEHPNLTTGEVGRVIVTAGNKAQAAHVLNYARGLMEASPILAPLIKRTTSEEIELHSGIILQVTTANFRRIRGVTALIAICDEIAFWLNEEESANPDSEIIGALQPALATTGGMLVAISSPYARRGELWENFSKYYGEDGDILVAKGATDELNLSKSPKLTRWIKRQWEKDPQAAKAEVGAEFRSDVLSYVSHEVVQQCTDPVAERRYDRHHQYVAFVDPSGGSSDAMTMAIGHQEGDIAVLDCLREVKAPFNPTDVVSGFCKTLTDYHITMVIGDRYTGQWCASAFAQYGIQYEFSELNRSEIYIDFLPMLNSKTVALLANDTLARQLVGLERKSGRGKDIVDHVKGGHDDLANAAAGCLALCASAGPGGGSGGDPFFNREIEYPEVSRI